MYGQTPVHRNARRKDKKKNPNRQAIQRKKWHHPAYQMTPTLPTQGGGEFTVNSLQSAEEVMNEWWNGEIVRLLYREN